MRRFANRREAQHLYCKLRVGLRSNAAPVGEPAQKCRLSMTRLFWPLNFQGDVNQRLNSACKRCGGSYQLK